MKTLQKIAFLLAVSFGFITLVPVLASAQTAVTTSAAVNTPAVTASTTVKLGAAETKAKTRGDTEIDRRIAALTDLNTRIQAMQKVTDAFKQGISTSITAEINTLTSLKAKIDADVDAATLKTDIQSITGSYRVFALVLPQGRIAAAADRQVAIVSMMSTLGSKLQARIQTAGQGGATTTSLTAALTDMATKLNEAQTKAQAAVTVSAALTPDAGDATKMKANNAALAEAKADLKTAQADIVAARKDADTIIKGLAKLTGSSPAASSTTQAAVH